MRGRGEDLSRLIRAILGVVFAGTGLGCRLVLDVILRVIEHFKDLDSWDLEGLKIFTAGTVRSVIKGLESCDLSLV